MADIVDKLFDSMSLILNKKLEGLEYNKTIICTIISTEDANKGKYLVTDGSTKFYAYSMEEKGKLREGDSVHVLIPNSDYNSKKFIVGKNVGDDDTPFIYIDPFDSYFDLTGNLCAGLPITEVSTLANSPKESKKTISLLQEIGDPKEPRIIEVPDGVGYNRLGIKADFKSLIPLAIAGDYGLMLKLYFQEPQKTTNESQQVETYYITLNSSDMWGNPYNFENYFTQSQVYDISDKGTLKGFSMFFYQKENFLVGKNVNDLENRLAYQYTDVDGTLKDLPDNLFLNNIYISLGIEASDKEEAYIYCGESKTFSSKATPEKNKKNIKLRWSHLLRDKENRCVALTSDEMVKEYIKDYETHIHWYRYDKTKQDELAGKFWSEIEWAKDKDHFLYELNPNTEKNYEYVKAIIELIDRKGLDAAEDGFDDKKDKIQKELDELDRKIADTNKRIDDLKKSARPQDIDSGLLNEQIKKLEEGLAVDIKERERIQKRLNRLKLNRAEFFMYIHSNTLDFVNEDYKKDPGTVEFISGGKLEIQDETKGVYRFYDGLTNLIVVPGESTKSRDAVLKFDAHGVVDTDTADIQKVIWYIPKRNTMVEAPRKGRDYILSEPTEEVKKNHTAFDDTDNDYYKIIRTNPLLSNIEVSDQVDDSGFAITKCELKQTFRIKKQLLQSFSNNTIKVELVRNNEVYGPYTAELTFGPIGMQGTNNTLILSLGDEFKNKFDYYYHNSLEEAKKSEHDYVVIPASNPIQEHKVIGSSNLNDASLEFKNDSKILYVMGDIDRCIKENWTNYYQPKVILTIEKNNEVLEEEILQIEDLKNIRRNGKIEKVLDAPQGSKLSLKVFVKEKDDTNITIINRFIVRYYSPSAENTDLTKIYYNLYSKIDGEFVFDRMISMDIEVYNGKLANLANGDIWPDDLSYFLDNSDRFDPNQTYYIYNAEKKPGGKEGSGVFEEIELNFVEGSDKKWQPGKYYVKSPKTIIEESPAAVTADSVGNYFEIKAHLYDANDKNIDDLIYSKNFSILYSGAGYTISKNNYLSFTENKNLGCIIKCTVKVRNPIVNYLPLSIDNKGEADSVYYYRISKQKETKNSEGKIVKVWEHKFVPIIGEINKSNQIDAPYDENDENNFNDKHYWYIQNSSNNTATEYTAYLPVAWRSDRKYYDFVGADRVVYNSSNGSRPVYYTGAYQVNGEVVKAEVHCFENLDIKFLPEIKNGSYLSPRNMYYHNIDYSSFFIDLKDDNEIIWNQPILIIQNNWNSSVLNSWDGRLKIDDNNYILTSALGAGIKDKDNTFSGVLMGEVGEKFDPTLGSDMGLYGYYQGQQSFGFKNDGTAFLGLSSGAQLTFEGANGVFQNAGYKNGTGIRMEMNGDPDKEQSIEIKTDGITTVRLSSNMKDNLIAGWQITGSELKAGGTTLNKSGKITCNNLEAKTSGTIGGFTIDGSILRGGAIEAGTITGTSINAGTITGTSISAGTITGTSVTCGGTSLTSGGSFTCNDITATGGTIGGCIIENKQLTVDDAKIRWPGGNYNQLTWVFNTIGDDLNRAFERIQVIENQLGIKSTAETAEILQINRGGEENEKKQ